MKVLLDVCVGTNQTKGVEAAMTGSGGEVLPSLILNWRNHELKCPKNQNLRQYLKS